LWPNGRGIVRRDGVLYFVNLQSRNWYDKHIVQLGADEPQQTAYFLDQIRRRQSDTFLDIGANFGTYTACVALQTNCGSVFAYEPDKRSYDWLRTHLFINGLADKVQTSGENLTLGTLTTQSKPAETLACSRYHLLRSHH
jgi:hypothetical protein